LSDLLVRKKGLKFGRRFLGILPMSMLALAFVVVALSSNNIIVIGALYFGQLLYSFIPVVSFSTCVDVGGHRAGTIAGTMNFFGQIGAFFLAITFGKFADAMHSFIFPMFLIAGVLLAGSVFWLFVDPTKELVRKNVRDEKVVAVT